ncbi:MULTISPECIES: DUF4350 domain-containing protein [unclassified Flavobacterium]|uniref:DUF4350 domain-containing protein n=1 Tax=unclassified Flavobacterium TaxID=196869 RepID=UPI001F13BE2D|nr:MULTISPECIES: DUF4350 domain-containing protein [unclassified Flavobacterium]UMY65544.1 DUF4350 domain-containing protein [Flavobacterium sp. HJ-32-4]
MTTSVKLFLGLCIAFFVLLLVADNTEPRPVDWQRSYRVADKNPLDLYVFNEEIDRLFGADRVERFGNTPYEYLNENIDYYEEGSGFALSGTIMSIGQHVDQASVSELLLFAANGNTVFISDYELGKALADSLHFSVKSSERNPEKRKLWTVNERSRQKPVIFDKGIGDTYFDKFDASQTQVLGYVRQDDAKPKPNYLRIRYLNGYFFLHLDPQAFSNYYLLHGRDARYAESTLSLLPHDQVYFFTDDARNTTNGSLTRFMFENVALRWAWLLLLGGLVVFIIFTAKRRQRVIPIVTPLSNTTVEFVQTVANLYRQEGEHGNLVEKKIIYFFERIRQEYRIDTTVLDDAFVKRLHLKSGKPEDDIRRVCDMINNFKRNRFSLNEEELIAFNEATEKIFS